MILRKLTLQERHGVHHQRNYRRFRILYRGGRAADRGTRDPSITYDEERKRYYFTASYPVNGKDGADGYDRLVIRVRDTIEGLADARAVVWDESEVEATDSLSGLRNFTRSAILVFHQYSSCR